MTQTLPVVSIIIPSYNRKDELLHCLDSISRQDYPNIEITVVDDNSSDGTAQAIQSLYPQTMIITDSVNCGPSYRRNQGILTSSGEYLLFLDSDVELQGPHIISRMVRRFQGNGNIGELGGEIPVYEGETRLAFGRGIGYAKPSHRIAAHDGDEELTACDYLATCNCMVKRDSAIQVGGFDPYYEFGAEDTDFGFMLQKQGYQNFVGFPYAVYHKASRTGRRPDETYRYCVTRIRFLLKHHGLRMAFPLFILDMIRVLIFYPLLPLKIPAKLLLKRPVGRESFTGGWLILKAYIWNLRHFKETRRSRTTNFLSDAEMQRFSNLKKRGGK